MAITNVDTTHTVTSTSPDIATAAEVAASAQALEDAFWANSAPTGATYTGTAGQLAWDENNFYYCYAEDSWFKLSGLTF